MGPFHEGRWGIETVILLPPLQSARRRRVPVCFRKNRKCSGAFETQDTH